MKKCPFCAEEIQEAAVKCKHCGEFLDPKARPRAVEERPWHFRDSTITILLLALLPLGLPLVWFNPYYSPRTKVVITLVVLAGSYFLWQASTQALKTLQEYSQMI